MTTSKIFMFDVMQYEFFRKQISNVINSEIFLISYQVEWILHSSHGLAWTILLCTSSTFIIDLAFVLVPPKLLPSSPLQTQFHKFFIAKFFRRHDTQFHHHVEREIILYGTVSNSFCSSFNKRNQHFSIREAQQYECGKRWTSLESFTSIPSLQIIMESVVFC